MENELIRPIARVMIVGAGWVGRQVGARLAGRGISIALTDKDPGAVADAVLWMQTCDVSGEHPLTVANSSRTGDLKASRPAGESTTNLARQQSSDSPSGNQQLLDNVLQFPPLQQLTSEQVAAWQPDLAIECVPEQISLKKRVLRKISDLVPRDCIIASNTSYFVPSVLAQFVQYPERFAHLHFHVPVLRDSVADIVGCPQTAPAVLRQLADLAQRIDQYPLVLKREHPGYVFNWLLQSVLKAALELVALDVVDVEDVDRSWKAVTGMPVGPFGMMDQIGLDVIDQVLSNARWAEPPQVDSQQLLAVIRPLIQQGRLGAKSGAGFYDYDKNPVHATSQES